MDTETKNLLQDALNRELTYYQQISQFLSELPARFRTQSQAESAVMDLISVLEIEGTTRRHHTEYIWNTLCSEQNLESEGNRLSPHTLSRLGQEDNARLLLKIEQWAYTIQRQLVKVVIFLKQFNRLNQQFLRLHDTLSNPAYTGKGLVRPKPGPRHMDQEA